MAIDIVYTNKELVKRALRLKESPKAKQNLPKQDMAWCIKFAIKDLEIARKELTEAAILARAKELFAIHG